jgi:hypothetical protein
VGFVEPLVVVENNFAPDSSAVGIVEIGNYLNHLSICSTVIGIHSVFSATLYYIG